MIFYRNGLYVEGYAGSTVYGEIIYEKTFQEVIAKGKGHYFYKDLVWGRYRIYGDTIKIQETNHPSLLSPTWMPKECWYLIINKTTLMPLGFKYIRTSIEEKDTGKIILFSKDQYFPATFFSAKTPYSEYSWLLKQKWFWCNESEYKQWKKQQKAKTKRK